MSSGYFSGDLASLFQWEEMLHTSRKSWKILRNCNGRLNWGCKVTRICLYWAFKKSILGTKFWATCIQVQQTLYQGHSIFRVFQLTPPESDLEQVVSPSAVPMSLLLSLTCHKLQPISNINIASLDLSGKKIFVSEECCTFTFLAEGTSIGIAKAPGFASKIHWAPAWMRIAAKRLAISWRLREWQNSRVFLVAYWWGFKHTVDGNYPAPVDR